MYFKKTLMTIALFLSGLNSSNAACETSISCLSSLTPPGDLGKIILIDPGHGGVDGGAVSGKGIIEKDINLSISLKLRNKLKACGYIVEMTREDDRGLYSSSRPLRKAKQEDLSNRCKLKRDTCCDLFISIHQNYFPESKYYGAQVWYCVPEESKLLAQIIQNNLRNDLDNNNKREEKSAGNMYRILKCHCEIPSVIVECGFLSNTNEAALLQDESYQQKIVESLSKSIQEYFELEKAPDININPNS